MSEEILKFIGAISTTGKDEQGRTRYIIRVPVEYEAIAKKHHGKPIRVTGVVLE